MEELLSSSIRELRRAAEEILPEAPLFLNGDPHRLVQVLSNLLNNSAKYTPEGGRIELTPTCQSDEVVITVKDNGLGIPAEMQEVIFERFAQIERPSISASNHGAKRCCWSP